MAKAKLPPNRFPTRQQLTWRAAGLDHRVHASAEHQRCARCNATATTMPVMTARQLERQAMPSDAVEERIAGVGVVFVHWVCAECRDHFQRMGAIYNHADRRRVSLANRPALRLGSLPRTDARTPRPR